tara:strand:- start:380 stop:847 length:468 start_codon:yes stop_codon:yes gene_type:complete
MTLQAYFNDPLFVGFDRMLDRMHQINSSQGKAPNYPPYNIVKKDDDNYIIELAIAGWKQDDIEINVEDGELKIVGKVADESDAPTYLHKGIGLRSFVRTFQLADTVVVKGAALVDGILTVALENIIPEDKKPKKIEIQSSALTLDHKGGKEFLSE